MTKPKNSPPPVERVPLTLEDRARSFVFQHWPSWSTGMQSDNAAKLLAQFAHEILAEAERAVTDQSRRPEKLSRIYWQSRMDAGREIHELRRGRGDTIVPRPNAEIDDALGTPAEWRKKHNDGGAE